MNTCVVLVPNILNTGVYNFDLCGGVFSATEHVLRGKRCIFIAAAVVVVVVVVAAVAAVVFVVVVVVVVNLTKQEEAGQRCCSQSYELYVTLRPTSTMSSMRQPDLGRV